MYSQDIHDTLLLIVAKHISQDNNGIAASISILRRKGFLSAKETLSNQLNSIRSNLRERSFNDESILFTTSISTCINHFNYLESLISAEFEIEYVQDRIKEELLIIKKSDLSKISDKLKKPTDANFILWSKESKYVWWFLIARDLFYRVINDIEASDKYYPKAKITRTIEFKPEHKQAGISILSYFSEIISKKYPDLDVGFKIEQNDNHVTLIIETPSGAIEKIEHELISYGLVVTGDLSVDQYLKNPTEIMMLKHKLEIANLEIRQTRDFLNSERTGLTQRINSLESEIGFMRSIFDKAQYESEKNSSAIRNLAKTSVADTKKLIFKLADLLENNENIDTEELNKNLKALASKSPTILDRVNDLLITGSIQGAAGNYLFAALQTIQKMV